MQTYAIVSRYLHSDGSGIFRIDLSSPLLAFARMRLSEVLESFPGT
jgi:hypothetical protein